MSSHSTRLAELIADAGRIAVFTGAGISTELGIPDFRSPGGVWSRMKPITFREFVHDEAMRREAWTRAFANSAGWVGAEPNAGHQAVARLVAAGKARAVITQNVDNLHQAAGVPSERVIELHGNASYAACLECGLRHELTALKQTFLGLGAIPSCVECGGIVKTAVISFGQPMPVEPMLRARQESLSCDLFLVLGSSLVVQPAASFPEIAAMNGARLVIVNREKTHLDDLARLVVNEDIGPVLSEAMPTQQDGSGLRGTVDHNPR